MACMLSQLWFIQRDANIRQWSVLGVDTPFESERAGELIVFPITHGSHNGSVFA